MKFQTIAALILANVGMLGAQTTPSNGQAMPPAYALPTPPVNGRTSPLPPIAPGTLHPTSDGMVASPDGRVIFRGPLPTTGNPSTPEEWRMFLVERLMRLPSPVRSGAVQLYGMGDEAAADILRILGKRGPLTVEEQRATLDILNMAFEHPESIIDPNHRDPGATMFLLKFIANLATDSPVRDRATEQLARIQALASTVQTSSSAGQR